MVEAEHDGDKQHFGFHGFWFALFPRVAGKTLHEPELSKKHYKSSADILWRIHKLQPPGNVQLQTSSQRRTDLGTALAQLNDMLENIRSKSYLDETRKLLQLKRSILLDKETIRPSFSESRNLIHGDFHNENLIFGKDDNVSCILDFEHTRLGNRIEDLVMFINLACCNTGYAPTNIQKSRLFLDAYQYHYECKVGDLYDGFSNFVSDLSRTVFLENIAIRNVEFRPMISRDLRRLTFLRENMREFVHSILG